MGLKCHAPENISGNAVAQRVGMVGTRCTPTWGYAFRLSVVALLTALLFSWLYLRLPSSSGDDRFETGTPSKRPLYALLRS